MRKTELERFMSKVRKTETCWEWTASVGSHGYGAFAVGSLKAGAKVARTMACAHVYSYALFRGPTGSMFVCHTCDNRRCVNPDHLFLGTSKDNVVDMIKKRRGLIGAKNGHAKLTEADVLAIRALLGKQRGKDIAAKFKVSHALICDIAKGRAWAHVKAAA